MEIKFRGKTLKEEIYSEISCDVEKDNYSVSHREDWIIVSINGKPLILLKKGFKVTVTS